MYSGVDLDETLGIAFEEQARQALSRLSSEGAHEMLRKLRARIRDPPRACGLGSVGLEKFVSEQEKAHATHKKFAPASGRLRNPTLEYAASARISPSPYCCIFCACQRF
jgi:hypothetical protein